MENINCRTENKVELKQANKAWMDCIGKKFVNQWMDGQDIKITDVCVEEHSRMMDLDSEINEPHPFVKTETV